MLENNPLTKCTERCTVGYMSTNGIPDSILEMNETDQEAIREERQKADHPDCAICGTDVCLSDCCAADEEGVVAPEDQEYVNKLYVHKHECLEIFVQPTVVEAAATLGRVRS